MPVKFIELILQLVEYPGIELQGNDQVWVDCGNRSTEKLFPVQYCTIVPWQPIKGLIGSKSTEDMLEMAQRGSRQAKLDIMGTSFGPLGLPLRQPPTSSCVQAIPIHGRRWPEFYSMGVDMIRRPDTAN